MPVCIKCSLGTVFERPRAQLVSKIRLELAVITAQSAVLVVKRIAPASISAGAENAAAPQSAGGGGW